MPLLCLFVQEAKQARLITLKRAKADSKAVDQQNAEAKGMKRKAGRGKTIAAVASKADEEVGG